MCMRDRGIDGDVPVDLVGSVGPGEQVGQDRVPGAVGGVVAVAFPDRLPGAELLAGKIPPGGAGAVAKDDAFDDLATVAKLPATSAGTAGQQGFNLVPLLVSQYLVPASFVAH